MIMRATQKKIMSGPGDQNIGWIENAQIGGIIRPAQGGKRPERRAEPRIQNIAFFAQRPAAFGHISRSRPGNDDFSARVAVPCRDPMPPPELARNAPVVNVVHPLKIALFKTVGNELDSSVFDCLDGRFGKRIDLQVPLNRDLRLHNGRAAIALSDVVLDNPRPSGDIPRLESCSTSF